MSLKLQGTNVVGLPILLESRNERGLSHILGDVFKDEFSYMHLCMGEKFEESNMAFLGSCRFHDFDSFRSFLAECRHNGHNNSNSIPV
jgi:hypothetical protein